MNNKWQSIWNKREIPNDKKINLEMLIKLDGFDSGAGYINPSDWRKSVLNTIKIIGINSGDSVFEVGCGSGAYLYAINELKNISGGGVDYSKPLIDIAKKALPKMNFECLEAINIAHIPKYDHCISHGVFHYFDKLYAEKVLELMIEKAHKSVAIIEVPDERKKNQSEEIRRQSLSLEEYEEKYKGLKHEYYNPRWFLDISKKLNLSCKIIENQTPNYIQKDFRYGVILKKN